MAYPDKDTAEWWDLVARGYRELIANPPKFIIPGSGPAHYEEMAKNAEARAEFIRNPVEFPKPTKAFEESLQRKEAEMEACGAKLIEPKRSVSEDVWRRVLGLD